MTSTHVYRDFPFTIAYLPQDPAYTVDFPDRPDVITSGDTLRRAFASACEALALHPESHQKLKLALPSPKCRLVVETS